MWNFQAGKISVKSQGEVGWGVGALEWGGASRAAHAAKKAVFSKYSVKLVRYFKQRRDMLLIYIC